MSWNDLCFLILLSGNSCHQQYCQQLTLKDGHFPRLDIKGIALYAKGKGGKDGAFPHPGLQTIHNFNQFTWEKYFSLCCDLSSGLLIGSTWVQRNMLTCVSCDVESFHFWKTEMLDLRVSSICLAAFLYVSLLLIVSGLSAVLSSGFPWLNWRPESTLLASTVVWRGFKRIRNSYRPPRM